MTKFLAVFLCFTPLLAMGISQSYAQQIIEFGPHDTKIEGSIQYSVIGQYIAHFNHFRGRITLNERTQQIQSVYLDIETESIESNHPRFDRMARSRRLLNAARYPEIIFKSDQIIHDDNGYKAKGVLEMHGINRRMIFPFKIKRVVDQEGQRELLEINGRWSINRKDFNIIWNKYLDHGGILVSDNFIVKWGIKAYIQ